MLILVSYLRSVEKNLGVRPSSLYFTNTHILDRDIYDKELAHMIREAVRLETQKELILEMKPRGSWLEFLLLGGGLGRTVGLLLYSALQPIG